MEKQKVLRELFPLTLEQFTVTNDLVVREGLCAFCKTEIVREERRSIVAQPHSTYTDQPDAVGNFSVVAICNGCFQDMKATILKCKEKEAPHA